LSQLTTVHPDSCSPAQTILGCWPFRAAQHELYIDEEDSGMLLKASNELHTRRNGTPALLDC